MVRQIPSRRLFADAHLNPLKVLRPGHCNNVLDSIMPAGAPFFADTDVPRRQADVVKNDKKLLLGIDLIIM